MHTKLDPAQSAARLPYHFHFPCFLSDFHFTLFPHSNAQGELDPPAAPGLLLCPDGLKVGNTMLNLMMVVIISSHLKSKSFVKIIVHFQVHIFFDNNVFWQCKQRTYHNGVELGNVSQPPDRQCWFHLMLQNCFPFVCLFVFNCFVWLSIVLFVYQLFCLEIKVF